MAKFIGGGSDGEEIAVDTSQATIATISTDKWSNNYLFSIDNPKAELPIVKSVYNRIYLKGEHEKFPVYLYTRMSIDEMFHRMISFYKTVPNDLREGIREEFEKFIKNRVHSLARYINPDGSKDTYVNCAVQLAWEAWLEASRYRAWKP